MIDCPTRKAPPTELPEIDQEPEVKLPWPRHHEAMPSNRIARSLWGLIGAQFLGAFNDHFYKVAVSLLVLDNGLRREDGGAYLSLSGAAYVLPFLLFSGCAGQLADRFDKRQVLIVAKAAEAGLGVLCIFVLSAGSPSLLIALLFLFAAQSAFFSPAKYGILPELVGSAALSRANGVLEFSRYVAIILGTAGGGIALGLWEDKKPIIGIIVLGAAISGWGLSYAIPRTGDKPSVTSVRPRLRKPLRTSFRLVFASRRLSALVGATTAVDFAMTYVAMLVLLLTKQDLGLGDTQSGILMAFAGIGVAFGSIAAGRLLPRWSILGCLIAGLSGATASLLMLADGESFWLLGPALIILGVSAGFFVVPLYTRLQEVAAPSERGRIIGANNLFNMTGVLLASVALWLTQSVAGLQARHALGATAVVILALAAIAIGWRLELRAMLKARGRRDLTFPRWGAQVGRPFRSSAANHRL